jgi:hypothetical protein
MIQSTFSTDIGTSPIEPVNILAILSGGIIKSNLSCIPPNPHLSCILYLSRRCSTLFPVCIEDIVASLAMKP